MEQLKIQKEETYKTPKVEYYHLENKLSIEGKLIPEDPLIFFSELEAWIEKFKETSLKTLNIELFLYYYNTSSLKRMIEFLEHLKTLKACNKEVKITWKCDQGDDDNISDGEDFKEKFINDYEITVVEA